VLVPRSKDTLVATCAWPTWVVSWRRVLEAVFTLLEFPSPSRRTFIGSHSLAPSLVRHIGPSSAARPGASARRAARHADRRAAQRRLLRLRRASGCPGTSRDSSLVVNYFVYAARSGASARRAAHRLLSTTSPMPRDWVPRHVARLIACRRLLRLCRASGCLSRSRGSSRGSVHRSSSTTSPTPCVRVPRHVARPVTRLIVDYSVRRDFVLRLCWLYFSHAVRRDYLSCGNTGSTSSTPRVATTSSSGPIASTIHLD
jgi:hypothetical protein